MNFFNKIKSNYIYYLIIIILSTCYTAARFDLNTEYKNATWAQIFNLEAPIPFGYRILVPIISKPIVYFGASIKSAFMFWELISLITLFVFLKKIFLLYLNDKQAQLSSIAFIYVLPLVFLLKSKWPLYYPYDTMAITFTTISLYLLLKEKWLPLCFVILIATFNRESSVLVIFLFYSLFFGKLPLKKFMTILIALLTLYFSSRYIIEIITTSNARPYGGSMAFYYRTDWRFKNNLKWLLDSNNIYKLLTSLGWLPLIYLFLRNSLPLYLRRINLTVISYFLMLFFVGNLYEPRQYGEIISLLFIITALAAHHYWSEHGTISPKHHISRYLKEDPNYCKALIKYDLLIPTLSFLISITLIHTLKIQL